jgi:hypothetical protein
MDEWRSFIILSGASLNSKDDAITPSSPIKSLPNNSSKIDTSEVRAPTPYSYFSLPFQSKVSPLLNSKSTNVTMMIAIE